MKLGHQAPHGFRVNRFNSIEIEGDLHYCKSHNFVYNELEEKKKLYDGKACFYTDSRYVSSDNNFYNNTKLHWTRWKSISLKSCIRKVLNCKNIPIGTIVEFNWSYFYTNRNFNNQFIFKIKKENFEEINYEVNEPSYTNNFTNCSFSKKLTTSLRENGFLVSVMKNESFIGNMINAASQYTNGEIEDTTIDGEIAIAFGHGKKIGFSSFKNNFQGYSDGEENILWDKFGEFDKWSRCNHIKKKNSSKSIKEIVETLKK